MECTRASILGSVASGGGGRGGPIVKAGGILTFGDDGSLVACLFLTPLEIKRREGAGTGDLVLVDEGGTEVDGILRRPSANGAVQGEIGLRARLDRKLGEAPAPG